MAQRIQTICDMCMSDDTESEASPYEIEIGGVKRAIDLCDKDAETLVMPLRTALKEVGRPIGSPSYAAPKATVKPQRTSENTSPDDFAQPCPIPTCEWGTMSEGRDMIRNHVRKEHGVDLRMIERYGPGPALAGVGASYACDLRGCAGKFVDMNSFMVHLRIGHELEIDKARTYAKAHAVKEEDQRDLFKQYGEGHKHGDQRES